MGARSGYPRAWEENPAPEDESCQRCGEPGASWASFMRVMSFLVFTRHVRYRAKLCPDCTARTAAFDLGVSCLLGWWGIPWGLMTFGAIWTDGRTLARSTNTGRIAAIVIVSLTAGVAITAVRGLKRSSEERRHARDVGDLVDETTYRSIERARAHYDAGDSDAALAEIRRAYQRAPDSAGINLTYGMIELASSEPQSARDHLERSLRSDPENDDARLALAFACRQLGDSAAELGCLQRASEHGVLIPAVHARLVDLLVERGDRAAASAHCREIASAHPGSALGEFLLGYSAEDSGATVEHLRAALRSDPGLTEARYTLVLALLDRREFDEARARIDELPATGREAMTRRRLTFLTDRREGRCEDALRTLDRMLADGESDSMAHLQRVDLLGACGRYEEARSELELARRQAGDDESLALMTCFQSLRLHVEAGRLAEARAELDGALAVERADESSARILLGWYRGLLPWLAGDLEAAAAAFADVGEGECELMSWRTPTLAEGLVLARLDRIEEARAAWRRVAESEPGSNDWEAIPSARLLLGELDPDAFLAEARRSDLSFDNNAHYYIGVSHELAGRLDAAREAYRAAVECSLGHNFPWQLAQQELQRLDPEERR